jgi:L-aspartate oxidase
MPRYHEAAELAPRDVVSRALVLEMHRCRSDFVYLDLTSMDPEHVKKRFPRIYSTCLEYNLDITADLMPVRPAAHYAMGGVATDLDGATSLGRLYAAGEAAASGVHGANRLASNSLLEGLVYGARAARAMAGQKSSARRAPQPGEMAVAPLPSESTNCPSAASPAELGKLVAKVRSIMWDKVGIIRSGKMLSDAVKRLDALAVPPAAPSRPHYEAQNVLEVARLIARSALAREESRGAHYRTDFPLKNDAVPPQHSFVAKGTPVRFDQDIPGRSRKASARASQR